MWGQMQIVVFHSFAYMCCTASFQPFCGMSAIRYKVLMIGNFRMDVTERLMNAKVVIFLEFLRFAMEFLLVLCNEIFDSLGKV